MKNLLGKRFGMLVVVEKSDKRRNGSLCWTCKCDCGNVVTVCGAELRNGDTRSCGCLHSNIVSDTMRTHGGRRDRLYGVWAGMWTRTTNKNATNYGYYGGRGITVCDEWKNYASFREWSLNNGYNPNAPSGKCTLDRIDSSGGYCPENCRWADMSVQNSNQRSNKQIEYNGETHNMKQWADILGINYSTFKLWIHNGKSIDDILNS